MGDRPQRGSLPASRTPARPSKHGPLGCMSRARRLQHWGLPPRMPTTMGLRATGGWHLACMQQRQQAQHTSPWVWTADEQVYNAW